MQTNHTSSDTFRLRFSHPALLTPAGRSNRRQYISVQLMLGLVFSLLLYQYPLLATAVFTQQSAPSMQLAMQQISGLEMLPCSLILIGLIYLNFICAIRRLHDINRSGSWSVLLLLPGIHLFLVLYLCLVAGCSRSNRFGHAPSAQTIGQLLTYMVILLLISLLSYGV